MADCKHKNVGCMEQTWQAFDECKPCKLLGAFGSPYRLKGNKAAMRANRPFIAHGSKYGLTQAQQVRLCVIQDNRCGICGNVLKASAFLATDRFKKARGFLCRSCSIKSSGMDDTEFMRRAKNFLDNPPVNRLHLTD